MLPGKFCQSLWVTFGGENKIAIRGDSHCIVGGLADRCRIGTLTCRQDIFTLQSIQCQAVTNKLPIHPAHKTSQSIANTMPIRYQLSTNLKPIQWQSLSNTVQILYQSSTNPVSILCQSIANLMPIRCQSVDNPVPIECQSKTLSPVPLPMSKHSQFNANA